jgi:hypothetical protein
MGEIDTSWRFHQSYAKTLLTGCPAELQWQLEEEARTPSRAMESGSLVDQLLLGGSQFHTVSANDWRTKAAKEQRDKARERGFIPVLAKDLGALETTAGRVRSRLLEHGIDLSQTMNQQTLAWTTEGVDCEGTPDIILHAPTRHVIVTADLKVGEKCSPGDLDRQVYDMCWDVQGAAYGEAALSLLTAESEGMRHEHWIIRAQDKGPWCVTICPLSEAYLELGRRRLRRARAIWRRCLDTGDWPEYESRLLIPPAWALAAEGGKI